MDTFVIENSCVMTYIRHMIVTLRSTYTTGMTQLNIRNLHIR